MYSIPVCCFVVHYTVMLFCFTVCHYVYLLYNMLVCCFVVQYAGMLIFLQYAGMLSLILCVEVAGCTLGVVFKSSVI